MRVGITGSTSQIGRAVQAVALTAGHTVEPLGRHSGQRVFELGKGLDSSVLSGLDAVIHLAWDRALSVGVARGVEIGAREDGNVVSSRELIEACSSQGIRLVFLSSTSARRPDKSAYGAAKLAVENFALQNESVVFRAGLIWGSEPPPIIQTLNRLANLPVILPLPTPTMMLDHNHESHVARMIVAALDWTSRQREIRSLASPEFVSSTQILKALRMPRRLIDVPVPSRLAASSARRLRDSGLVGSPRLDSIALLDTSSEDLDFDPAYPAEWGADTFLRWLRNLNEVSSF